MSYKSNWDNGGWKAVCDVCGRVFKNNELKTRWDGLIVCHKDWETRQPQDFVHGIADIQAPVWVRPESSDYFVPINYTQQPNEIIDVTEVLVKAVVKTLGTSSFDSQSALNGAVINAIALNATTTYTNEEIITITETVLVTLGRTLSDAITVSESRTNTATKQLSDSSSISESLQLAVTKAIAESLSISESTAFSVGNNIAETVSISESVSRLLVSPTALNGAALNSLRLD